MNKAMHENDDDAIEHDRHLRAALRHAPDADAAPPAALSARILRQARESVAVARPRRRAWAPSFALPWAGGLAAMLVATTVGLLWWAEPVPSPREAAMAPVPVAMAPIADIAVASAPVVADAPVESAPAAAAPSLPRPPSAAARVRHTSAPPKLATTPAPAATTTASIAAPGAEPAAPTAAAAPPRQAAAEARIVESARPSQPPPRSADASTAAEAQATRAPLSRSATAPAAVGTLAKASAPPPPRRDGLADAALGATAQRAEASRERDLAGATATGPQLPEGLDDAAARAWLARLNAEAGARWQRHAGALPADGKTRRWVASTGAGVTVVLTPSGAFWRDDRDGRNWAVPLDAAQLERLGDP